MLTSPKVLVLDEALASVDARAEAAIKRALATWFADATVLHVAHRLSAISDVERVLVFEDGALVEDGTPAADLPNQLSPEDKEARKDELTSFFQDSATAWAENQVGKELRVIIDSSERSTVNVAGSTPS